MRVIIAGSRHMQTADYPLIGQAVSASGFTPTEIVSGMAPGADTLGMAWAVANNLPIKKFPADWKRYGRAAGPIRNSQMRDYAQALIVLIWANSRGSLNMLLQMQKAGKPIFAVPDGDLQRAYK